MQLTLDRNTLVEKLELLQTIANARTTLPILNNILFEADEAEEQAEGTTDIILTANNLEIAVGVNVPAIVVEAGITTIPCKKFYELIREIPLGSSIDLSVDEANYIRIKYDLGEYKLKGLDPEQFPAQPPVDEGVFVIPGTAFYDLLDKTLFAASLEEVRYFLNAVCFTFGQDKTTAVATDGRKLAVATADSFLAEGIDPITFILPLKTAREALKTFTASQSISCSITKGQVAFTDGSAVLTARLIEGDYPDYKQIVPESQPFEVSVNRDAFTSGIRRVSLLADPRNYSIQVSVEQNAINLEVETPDLGAAKEEVVLKTPFEGTPTVFKFDARLLLEGLEQIKTENAVLKFEDSNTMVVIKPPKEDSYFNVSMPLRLEDLEDDEAEETPALEQTAEPMEELPGEEQVALPEAQPQPLTA